MINFNEFDLELDITGAYELDGNTRIEETCNESYPYLVNSVLKFIDEVKSSSDSEDLSLVEIIVQYSFKNNIDIRLIGDAIKDDEYLKSFIKKDSQFHGVISNPDTSDVW